jgi:hypothetical protein
MSVTVGDDARVASRTQAQKIDAVIWSANEERTKRVGSHRVLRYTPNMTSSRVRWLFGSSLLLGCGPGQFNEGEGFSDGYLDEIGTETGDGDEDEDDEDDEDDDSDSDSEGDGDGECPTMELEEEPFVYWGDEITADESSSLFPLCAPEDTRDHSLVWIAPEAGTYRMTLFSDVGAWGAVLDSFCEGAHLACVPGSGESVQFEAHAGQTFTFVVESAAPGPYELWIELQGSTQECPTGQLFGPSHVVSSSTVGASPQFSSECGGEESSDEGWLFIPEVSGVYRLDTTGSNFDTLLHVFGDVCGGPVLACIDDTQFGTAAAIDVELQAGLAYTIVVDGWGGQVGDYELSLELVEATSLCDGAELLPSTLPASLSWGVEEDLGNQFFGCSFANNERRLLWTAPEDALVRVRQDAFPNFSAIAVFPDGCAEGQFECQTTLDVEPEVVLPVVAGQELLIVSEYEPGQPGDVTLTIEPVEDVVGCGTPMPEGVPSQVMGTTSGFNNDHSGSCSFNPAPEREWWWRAPATGHYVISTAGSAFDTLLYVRDGGCDGEELACNDDFIDLSSQVEVDLFAGQTISIFADGFSGAGSFVLTITEG